MLIYSVVTDAVLQSAEYREASCSDSELSVVLLLDQIHSICNSEFKMIIGLEELKQNLHCIGLYTITMKITISLKKKNVSMLFMLSYLLGMQHKYNLLFS